MKLLMHSKEGNRNFDATKEEDCQLIMFLIREELTACPASEVRITRVDGFEQLTQQPVC